MLNIIYIYKPKKQQGKKRGEISYFLLIIKNSYIMQKNRKTINKYKKPLIILQIMLQYVNTNKKGGYMQWEIKFLNYYAW